MQTEGIQVYSALTPPHEVCAMLRNYLKYFVMIPILHIFSEMHPRAGFPGVPNSPADPKVTQTLGDKGLFGYDAGPWVSASQE